MTSDAARWLGQTTAVSADDWMKWFGGMAQWNPSIISALDLGLAWAEVESALPEGWDFGISMKRDGLYHASAAPLTSTFAYRDGEWAEAPTPTAALRALAAKLRERA